MKNGNEPLRSTPADVVNTKRLMLRGVAAIRFWLEIQSVCSGPLSPSHLQPSQTQQLMDKGAAHGLATDDQVQTSMPCKSCVKGQAWVNPALLGAHAALQAGRVNVGQHLLLGNAVVPVEEHTASQLSSRPFRAAGSLKSAVTTCQRTQTVLIGLKTST